MALTHADWKSIYAAIADALPATEIILSKVTKTSNQRRVIWTEDTGDQPIPLVGQTYEVKYYDETPLGTKKKTADAKVQAPAPGDLAVILMPYGQPRLGKCLGTLLANPKDFVSLEDLSSGS